MKIITVTPFRTDLSLPAGVTDFSEAFDEIIDQLQKALDSQANLVNQSLSDCHFEVVRPGDGEESMSSDNAPGRCRYLDLKKDNKDIRLALIRLFPSSDQRNLEEAVQISVYNNTLSIAQVPYKFNLPDEYRSHKEAVADIRESALEHTRKLLVYIHYELLQPAFRKVVHDSNRDTLGLRQRLPKRWRKSLSASSALHFEPIGAFLGFFDLNRIVAAEREKLTDASGHHSGFKLEQLQLGGKTQRKVEPSDSREAFFDRRILWSTFTLVLDRKELEMPHRKDLVREWLTDTLRPEDAEKIIRGETCGPRQKPADYSFTWLNYLYIANNPASGGSREHDERLELILEALQLAQYFYSTHDIYASNLQRTLSEAFRRKKTRGVEKVLKSLSSRTQYNLIHMNELRLELNREKKGIFDDIMDGWEHEELFNNGQRMIDMTRRRLDDLDCKRRESSSFLTDIILGFLALIGILDLSIGLSSFSREIMSQPVLLHKDTDYPDTLRTIATLDIDTVLSLSVLTIIFLFGIYVLSKLR